VVIKIISVFVMTIPILIEIIKKLEKKDRHLKYSGRCLSGIHCLTLTFFN